MKYGSVCSGIEAATVAWHPLGFEPQWFSEIEKFPSAVLAHHYPTVPNLGDMTKIHETETFKRNPIDLLVGGTPCQSFSVAGLRKGMDDPRGNLALVFLGLIDKSRPRWVVWENVPGVLSSKQGRDFGSFVGGLGELGYGWAYRVLDAQYFGVPQRRRRVFVVGYLGDWRPAAAVLFERESLSWNLTPSRKEGKVAPTLSASGAGVSRTGGASGQEMNGDYYQVVTNELCPTLQARDYKDINSDDTAHGGKHVIEKPIAIQSTIIGRSDKAGPQGSGYDESGNMFTLTKADVHAVAQPTLLTMRDGCEGGGKGPLLQKDRSGTLATGNGQVLFQPGGVEGETFGIPGNWIGRKPENGGNATEPMRNLAPNLTKTDRHAVATPIQAIPISTQNALGRENGREDWPLGIFEDGDPAPTLSKAHGHAVGMAQGNAPMQVRRLTPVECARLQGFPDDYLDIQFRGKPASDGPKYKALGNSMAVPVMNWIGKRIKEYES